MKTGKANKIKACKKDINWNKFLMKEKKLENFAHKIEKIYFFDDCSWP